MLSRSILSVSLVAILLPGSPLVAMAGSAASTFRVTATLDPTCTIQTTPATFGRYNPLMTHSKQPLDVNSTVTITCSKGMATTIALDRGRYGEKAQGTTRAMKHASADEYLSYELYQDVYRTILWGTAGQNLFVPPIAPDTNPRTFLIFGRIFPAQDVLAGDYADTVVAIVNF
ncbi:MAG TPA: spore coat U domain-containing protein [Nitrospira sp.]|nr:spore coat U domain-containing protein [Nitrospira sp.]